MPETKKKSTRKKPRKSQVNPIVVECDHKGHKGEQILYKREGWRFKHLKQWESGITTIKIVEMLNDRIQSWTLKDADGSLVPFPPEEGREDNLLDEFESGMASWIVGSFRMAYYLSSTPDPKAFSEQLEQEKKG